MSLTKIDILSPESTITIHGCHVVRIFNGQITHMFAASPRDILYPIGIKFALEDEDSPGNTLPEYRSLQNILYQKYSDENFKHIYITGDMTISQEDKCCVSIFDALDLLQAYVGQDNQEATDCIAHVTKIVKSALIPPTTEHN